MTFEFMKQKQAEADKHFFSDSNIAFWNLVFEDTPNECGIFIVSGTNAYEWEPKNAEGKTYTVKIFHTKDAEIEGILFNGKNFDSLETAKRMKANVTRALLESGKGFDKGVVYTEQNMLRTPELMMFVSPTNESITLNLDEIGG